MKLADVGRELRHRLFQRGPEGVIGGFRKNVRAGRDQMCADAERRTRFGPVFDDDSRLVDLARLADFFELLLDQRGEPGGWVVMEMFEDDFHVEFSIRPEDRRRLSL